MGQTLTHGVYLPDEGERNCYSGLAANWSILDGAVGTVAEHTSALSGKAPLVHTHSKSDITDFPVYGTTAGTICEGNDSRLSDARTPVAHTHGKADITDLFNSANTWSEVNIFSNFIISKENAVISAGGYGKGIAFYDYQNNRFGFIQPQLTSDNEKRLLIGADSGDIASNSNIIPNANNANNLGSSAYQWSNLYAKNYYYNGVAWGLDKANVWTGSNQFNASVKFSGQTGINWARGGTVGTLPSSVLYYGFQNALDSNDNIFDRIRSYVGTAGTNFQEHVKYAWNDLTKYVTINYWINADGSDSEYKLSVKRLVPASSNATDLGTSTNKWKTLNGINPGALSMPDMGTTADVNYFDFISIITHLDGTDNFYTPTVDGWMTVIIVGTALSLFEDASSGDKHTQGSGISASPVNDYCLATIPVHKSKRVKIQAIGTSVYMAQVRPCLGNV